MNFRHLLGCDTIKPVILQNSTLNCCLQSTMSQSSHRRETGAKDDTKEAKSLVRFLLHK